MSGPWEDFQKGGTATAESGPWEDFKPKKAAAPAAPDLGAAPLPQMDQLPLAPPRDVIGPMPGLESGQQFGGPVPRTSLREFPGQVGRAALYDLGVASDIVTKPLAKIAPKFNKNDWQELLAGGREALLTIAAPAMSEEERRRYPAPGSPAWKYMRPEDDKILDVLTGAGESATDMVNFFTSPLGIATLGMGSLPAAAQRTIAAAFAAQMASQAPEIAKELGNELGKPEKERDNKKLAKLITDGVAITGFTVAGGYHALKPRPDILPFESREERVYDPTKRLPLPERGVAPAPSARGEGLAPAPSRAEITKPAVPEVGTPAERLSMEQEIREAEIFTRKGVQEHFEKTGGRVPNNEEAGEILARAWKRPPKGQLTQEQLEQERLHLQGQPLETGTSPFERQLPAPPKPPRLLTGPRPEDTGEGSAPVPTIPKGPIITPPPEYSAEFPAARVGYEAPIGPPDLRATHPPTPPQKPTGPITTPQQHIDNYLAEGRGAEAVKIAFEMGRTVQDVVQEDAERFLYYALKNEKKDPTLWLDEVAKNVPPEYQAAVLRQTGLVDKTKMTANQKTLINDWIDKQIGEKPAGGITPKTGARSGETAAIFPTGEEGKPGEKPKEKGPEDATRIGPQREHIGTPQGADVPPQPTEIRTGEGQPDRGGGRTVSRTPSEKKIQAQASPGIENVGALSASEFFDVSEAWRKEAMAAKDKRGMTVQDRAERAGRANPDLAKWQKAAADAAADAKRIRDELLKSPSEMLARQREMFGASQKVQFFNEAVKEIERYNKIREAVGERRFNGAGTKMLMDKYGAFEPLHRAVNGMNGINYPRVAKQYLRSIKAKGTAEEVKAVLDDMAEATRQNRPTDPSPTDDALLKRFIGGDPTPITPHPVADTLKNPRYVSDKYAFDRSNTAQGIADLRSRGHDGIIFDNAQGDVVEAVKFGPEPPPVGPGEAPQSSVPPPVTGEGPAQVGGAEPPPTPPAISEPTAPPPSSSSSAAPKEGEPGFIGPERPPGFVPEESQPHWQAKDAIVNQIIEQSLPNASKMDVANFYLQAMQRSVEDLKAELDLLKGTRTRDNLIAERAKPIVNEIKPVIEAAGSGWQQAVKNRARREGVLRFTIDENMTRDQAIEKLARAIADRRLKDLGGSFIPPIDPVIDFIAKDFKQFFSRVDAARKGFTKMFPATTPRKVMIQKFDAADTMAHLAGRRIGNRLRLGTTPTMRQAAYVMIEAKSNPAALQTFLSIAKAKASPDIVKAVEYAIAAEHYNDMGFFDYVNKARAALDNQYAREVRAGLNFAGGFRNAYVPHYYEGPLKLSSGHEVRVGYRGRGTVATGFMKHRDFPNIFAAIDDGYKPQSIDVADVIEHRVRQGERLLNRRQWAEQLATMKDPKTGLPIAMTPDPDNPVIEGYVPTPLYPGVTFAVHPYYERIFKALTRESGITGSMLGSAALTIEQGIKHNLLMFDTFHLSRMLQREAALHRDVSGFREVYGMETKGVGFRKGHSLLEWNPSDLDEAWRRGEITADEMAYARANQADAQLLIKNGLNVGRVSENIYMQYGSRLGKAFNKLQVPSFNRYVFEKVTRGAIMESALSELGRVQKSLGLTREQAAQKVARDLNIYYGNLQRQGWLVSQSARDLAQILFLAPQWVESMARTEVGSVTRPIAETIATGKPTMTSIPKGVWTGLIAYFIGAQFLNMATRGHPTWDNPERDHKFDAFLPGPPGSRGLFLPIDAVMTELTSEFRRFSAQKTKTDAAMRIVTNKFSPLTRAAKILYTGTDFDTRQLTGRDRWLASLMALVPTPIPFSPIMAPAEQAVGAKPHTGATLMLQFERQALSSLGWKSDYEPSKMVQAYAIVRDWKKHNEDPKIYKKWLRDEASRYPQSEYYSLRSYLAQGNLVAARTVWGRLGKSQKEVERALSPFAGTELAPGVYLRRQREPKLDLETGELKPGTPEELDHFKPIGGLTDEQETKFYNSLNDTDKKVIDDAKLERLLIYQRFHEAMDPINSEPVGNSEPVSP